MDEQIYHIPIGTSILRNGIALTLTEEGWRAELQHSMMRRCKGWDYCRPWIYLITIGCQHHDEPPMPQCIPVKSSCSGSNSKEVKEVLTLIPSNWQHPAWLKDCYKHNGRPHLFGELAGTEVAPFIVLNDLGKAVDEQIMAIPTSFPQVKIIERIVMPNHIHFIIRIKEQLPENKPLGYIIDRFKSWVNRRYKEIALGLPANTVMCSCRGNESASSGKTNRKLNLVFEKNFHDRILFREGQLDNMINYCRENPLRLWKVVHNSQYFHTLAGIKLTMPILAEGGTAGRGRWSGSLEGLLAPVMYSCSGSKSKSSPQSSGSKSTPQSTSGDSPNRPEVTVTFNAVGNYSLFAATERIQIQCSRSMTEETIAQKKEEVLALCEHGVVPISPCISPGEKAIARAVMDAGHNIIALFPQGIPDTTFKPYKQFFDACAMGQLLLLSPWKYEHGVSHVKRWQCLFLNDIAAQLTVI